MKTLTLALVLALPACGGGDSACDPSAPNSICTIVGSTADLGYTGDNGPALDADMYIPMDTALAPSGELWLLDFNNYVIRAVDSTGTIRTVIGNGEVGDSPTQDGVPAIPALNATFNHTTDLFFHDGYLYLAAWHNSRVKRVSLDDMMLEVFAGRGIRTYYDGDGGPALKAALDLPSSIALDPAGNIAIMDQANQAIRVVDLSTQNIQTIVGTCVVEDMPCATGVMPVACPNSDKFACGDPAVECANPCTPGFAGDGGPALAARLGQPFGQAADPAGRMVYDHAGNLIFADTGNNRVRKVDTSGIITTIAGTGEAGYSGDDGPGIQAQINKPVDVAVDDANNVYFTDVDNNCIRKISTSGTISRVAGVCSSNPADRAFSGDGGPPLEAKMNRPYGIDLVGKKLYVSDSYNNRVRLVNLP